MRYAVATTVVVFLIVLLFVLGALVPAFVAQLRHLLP